MEFEWRLLPLSGSRVDASTILRFVDFANSTYTPEPVIYEFEDQGKRGYVSLVEGVSTGMARVSARVVDSTYTDVAAEVVLTVMEKLELIPVCFLFLFFSFLLAEDPPHTLTHNTLISIPATV